MRRPCLDCGTPTVGPRCPVHQRAQRAKYGPLHQAERAAWSPLVASGQVECWRCELPIDPTTPWDLGHRPDGTRHPEHAQCNRSAAARGEP